MKKIAIPYAAVAFALGLTLIALGIYLCSIDLSGMLLEKLEGSGSAGLVLYLVLFIPIILARILLAGFIVLGIPYLFGAGFAFAGTLRYDLDSLMRNSRAVTIYNSVILTFNLLFDFVIVSVYLQGVLIPVILIAFAVPVSALIVALEVLSVLTGKKIKKIIDLRWRSF